MKKCKTDKGACPFLIQTFNDYYGDELEELNHNACCLGYLVINGDERASDISPNCKLEVVQYALKNSQNSITFIPDEERNS